VKLELMLCPRCRGSKVDRRKIDEYRVVYDGGAMVKVLLLRCECKLCGHVWYENRWV